VYQQDVLIRCGFRSDKIGRPGDSGCQKAIMNAAIFLSGKDVCSDGKKIVVAVYEFEGKHGSTSLVVGFQ
jgi:hypothetical protein